MDAAKSPMRKRQQALSGYPCVALPANVIYLLVLSTSAACVGTASTHGARLLAKGTISKHGEANGRSLAFHAITVDVMRRALLDQIARVPSSVAQLIETLNARHRLSAGVEGLQGI